MTKITNEIKWKWKAKSLPKLCTVDTHCLFNVMTSLELWQLWGRISNLLIPHKCYTWIFFVKLTVFTISWWLQFKIQEKSQF